jgi:hypothetical protein
LGERPEVTKKKFDHFQVVEGRWYCIAWGSEPFLEECCDCGLVHKVRYRLRRGRIEVSYKVDPRRTKAARKLRKGKAEVAADLTMGMG